MEATQPFPHQPTSVSHHQPTVNNPEVASGTSAVAAPPVEPTVPFSTPISPPMDPEAKKQFVRKEAFRLFERKTDWVTFFREILGHSGIARRTFPTLGEMTEFEKTVEYAEIQGMLAELRTSTTPVPNDEDEPTRVITVRLPKSLHESLRSEAHERKTSMNKLCISKLLQLIDQQLVPHEQ